jgi:hypothetical protein
MICYPTSGCISQRFTPGFQRAICTLEFIAAFFMTEKMWKHPKYLIDKFTMKVQYSCPMKYYSTLKKKEILTHEATEMNLRLRWLLD